MSHLQPHQIAKAKGVMSTQHRAPSALIANPNTMHFDLWMNTHNWWYMPSERMISATERKRRKSRAKRKGLK
jgi:hypothetical protein